MLQLLVGLFNIAGSRWLFLSWLYLRIYSWSVYSITYIKRRSRKLNVPCQPMFFTIEILTLTNTGKSSIWHPHQKFDGICISNNKHINLIIGLGFRVRVRVFRIFSIWVIILFFGWGTLKYLFVKSVRFKTTQDFSRILNFWGSFYSPYSHSVRDKYLLFFKMHSYVENSTLKWHIKSFVNTACAGGSKFDENSHFRGMSVKCQL